MAKNKPLPKNEQSRGNPRTVDRQMVVPQNYQNTQFPVTSANPKRRELNPAERRSYENKFADAPKILHGTSRQSRY